MTQATIERPGLAPADLEAAEPPASPAMEPEEPDGHYEVIDGRRVELPLMGAREAYIASRLSLRMGAHAQARDLGNVLVETLYALAPGRELQRKPDVSFISYDRWPKGRQPPRGNAWRVIPDLAVEVVSPNDPAVDLVARIRDFFEKGVRQVWVVLPDEWSIYVYDSPKSIRVLDRADTLDGGAILPGFRLPLAEFFEPEGEEAPAGDQASAASAGAAE